MLLWLFVPRPINDPNKPVNEAVMGSGIVGDGSSRKGSSGNGRSGNIRVAVMAVALAVLHSAAFVPASVSMRDRTDR